MIKEELHKKVIDMLSCGGDYRSSNFMYNMILKSVYYNTAIAEDLYSEFVAKIIELISADKLNYDESAGFALTTYMGTICNNFIIDYIRSTQSKRNAFNKNLAGSKEVDFGLLDLVDTPYEDRLEKAFRALDLVKGEKGFLFLEDRLLGLKYEEIAEKYEVPLGTVKAHLSRLITILESRAQFSLEFQKNDS